MASNLIFRIMSQFGSQGTDAAATGMNKVRESMEATAKSSSSLASSFGGLKSILIGGVMALPFTGFVKEAIQSEEVTARFGLRLQSLGEDSGAVMQQISGLTDKIHKAGVSQTQFIQALAQGAPYFKDTRKEIALLDTAIGMTRVRGISLAAAFQQLGYITMGYGTRIARQYGVAMHNEIRNPTERGAAIIADLTKKMEPLAGATGTTSEALKEMGVTIKDIGEKLGASMLEPIGSIAKAFNSLDWQVKQTTVDLVIMGGTLIGIVKIVQGLSSLGAAVTGLKAIGAAGTGLAGIAAPAAAATAGVSKFMSLLSGAAIGGLAIAALAVVESFRQVDEQEKKLIETTRQYKAEKLATLDATFTAADKEASMFEDTEERMKELEKTREQLFKKALQLRNEYNRPNLANVADQQRAEVELEIKYTKEVAEGKKTIAFRTAEAIKKAYIEATDGEYAYKKMMLEKQLSLAMEMYGRDKENAIMLRRITEEELKKIDEAEVKSYASKFKEGLSVEMMLTEEREKYNKQLEIGKDIMRTVSSKEDIGKLVDDEKQILATKGGQVAMEEAIEQLGKDEFKRVQARREHEDSLAKLPADRERWMKKTGETQVAIGIATKKQNEDEIRYSKIAMEEMSASENKREKDKNAMLRQSFAMESDMNDKKRRDFALEGKDFDEEERKEKARLLRAEKVAEFEKKDAGFLRSQKVSAEETAMQDKERLHMREKPLDVGTLGAPVMMPITFQNTFQVTLQPDIDATANVVKKHLEEVARKGPLELDKQLQT